MAEVVVMARNKMNVLDWTMIIGGCGVGGLVHVLQPLGIDILPFFGVAAPYVQFAAGALGVAGAVRAVLIARK